MSNESIWTRLRHGIRSLFDLNRDKAPADVIDAQLRAGVELVGSTPWILIFAILIASIGLNVNSPAVIIGAMLISPLMGPIMGIGYGVGIYDFPLIRKSLFNLFVAALVSLLASTSYFLLSPLSHAQSELLARTSPTIWDVLIALFGGLAGMVGATRQEKSNVVPGVAIATALMPPLCTAGYGLAHAQWNYFFGAFYLFSINSVFIATSAVIVCGFLHLPHKNFVDAAVERRVKHLLFAVVAVTALPSFYLASQLVSNEVFKYKADAFVRSEFRFKKAHVIDTEIVASKKEIAVTLIGVPVSAEVLNQVRERLGNFGLDGARLVVYQGEENRIDLASIRTGILSELLRSQQLAKSETNQEHDTGEKADFVRELYAQYPEVQRVWLGRLDDYENSQPAQNEKKMPVLLVFQKSPLKSVDKERVRRWFRTYSREEKALVIFLPKLLT